MNEMKAFVLGLIDGWQQPIEVNSSHNVEHLYRNPNGHADVYEWHDRGINVGQRLRAPFRNR